MFLSTCVTVSPLLPLSIASIKVHCSVVQFLTQPVYFLNHKSPSRVDISVFFAHFPVVVFGLVTGTGSPYSISIIGDLMQESRFV